MRNKIRTTGVHPGSWSGQLEQLSLIWFIEFARTRRARREFVSGDHEVSSNFNINKVLCFKANVFCTVKINHGLERLLNLTLWYTNLAISRIQSAGGDARRSTSAAEGPPRVSAGTYMPRNSTRILENSSRVPPLNKKRTQQEVSPSTAERS